MHQPIDLKIIDGSMIQKTEQWQARPFTAINLLSVSHLRISYLHSPHQEEFTLAQRGIIQELSVHHLNLALLTQSQQRNNAELLKPQVGKTYNKLIQSYNHLNQQQLGVKL